MSWEQDYDVIRERELNEYLERKFFYKPEFDPDYFDECKAERYEQAHKEFNDWLDSKEIND